MADVILKNRDGDDVTYSGVEAVKLVTADGGTQIFSKGQAVEGMVIVPDFSGGDQAVTAPEGFLVKSGTIQKPDTLTPNNIRDGVTVAGVEGAFIGDTEEAIVALDMAAGDQVIEPTAAGKVLSSVTVQKPETLVPENIAEGVDIAGIVGTLAAGGGGGSGDWNVAVGVFTAGSATASIIPITVLTVEELKQNGIVCYPSSQETSNHLKTLIFLTRIDTASSTSGTAKRLNFAYFQNWQMSNNGSYTYYNGIRDYQSATTTVKTAESYQTSKIWSISETGHAVSLSESYGLGYLNSTYSSYNPIGTYLIGVIQHKYALVSDTLT